MNKNLRKSSHCLNCLKEIGDDNYCPDCGQQNTNKNVSFRQLAKDFTEDYFNIDSKIYKSLVPLIFKPGFLTIKYNKGRRNTYITPLRMYLIISVIFFLTPSADKNDTKYSGSGSETKNNKETPDTLILAKDTLSVITSEEETDNRKSDTSSGSLKLSINTPGSSGFVFQIPGSDSLIYMDESSRKEKLEQLTQQVLNAFNVDKNSYLAHLISKICKSVFEIAKNGKENFYDKFLNNVAKMMFILLPLFALFLKLLYFKKGLLYIESLVFAFHYHSFVFLVLTVDHLVEFIQGSSSVISVIISFITVFLICFYLIKSMKEVFSQSYFKTIFKFLILSISYLICLSLFTFITVITTLLLY